MSDDEGPIISDTGRLDMVDAVVKPEGEKFYGIEAAIERGELRLEWGRLNSSERIPLTQQVLLDMWNNPRRRAGLPPRYPDAPSLSKPQDNSPMLGSNKGRGNDLE